MAKTKPTVNPRAYKRSDRYTESGRAGRLVYLLMLQGPLSVEALAKKLECTPSNIYKLRDSLSVGGAVPIDMIDGEVMVLMMDMEDWY